MQMIRATLFPKQEGGSKDLWVIVSARVVMGNAVIIAVEAKSFAPLIRGVIRWKFLSNG